MNVQLASVSVDSPYSHLAWARQLEVEFPMISDFGRKLLRDYDVLGPGSELLPETALRSAFVIDQGGKIRYSWQQPAEGGLPPVDEILEAAGSLVAS